MPKRSPPSGPPTAMKPGLIRASVGGTKRYSEGWRERFASDFYRTTRDGLTASSIALGTYLGESDDATDAQYYAAARAAITGGINVVDTAINYRCQRSERVIGRVLQTLLGEGAIRRDEVILCTKAGYLPIDGTPPASRDEYERYVRREYFDSGVLAPGDLVAGGHAITPRFIDDQLHRSMRNLGVQAIDCFYLHNPEQQLSSVTPRELYDRIRLAFEALESFVSQGTIGVYGVATWSALRLPAGSAGHLSLYELAAAATQVAGSGHHFRMVQLPVNLSMSEAVRVSTQRDPRGRLVHVVDAAAELGIDLVVSAPLLQGQLTQNLPDSVRELFPGNTDAQRALAFARSLPVLSVAVGTRTTEHVSENLAGVVRPSV
jgi:aryl-alcohol dehydrogenase-like predicted oxidoreductase